MRRSSLRALLGVTALPAALFAVASCTSSQTPPVVRSFQRPENMDVICMKVLKEDGTPSLPVPAPQDNCAPVATTNDAGATLPYHLYALVTQETLGEVAVVDLTAGFVVDEDRSTPGTNFIPVGALPAGITSSPDGKLAYVASAAPNKAAIYAIPAERMLGDSQGPVLPDGGDLGYHTPALRLSDLPVCQLPGPPMSVSIVTNGADGGVAAGYTLVAVLRGSSTSSASVVAIDPSQLAASAGVAVPGLDAGATGMVAPCPLLGAPVPLASVPPSGGFTFGPPWGDGIPYIDGGVSLADAEPPPGPLAICPAPVPSQFPDGGFGYLPTPTPTSVVVRNDQANLLYVADGALPLIHVFDLSQPGGPIEREPLRATSRRSPSRVVHVGGLALSPATSQYQRFLYAIDQEQGSIIVYDVTDPVTSPHVPLLRPHPELNPFQEPDRIGFSSPVAAVSFARHDWPLPVDLSGAPSSTPPSAVICNPNPQAHPSASEFDDFGAFYRGDVTNVLQVGLGPTRLRGIFGFAALSNGAIATIDVDDWDAPCRRPDPMTSADQISDLAVPQPNPTGPTDYDPYHAPFGYSSGTSGSLANGTPVTLESFYPVSAPHRARSAALLRNDPNAGNHMPNITLKPVLFNQTTTLATSGTSGVVNAAMLPTVPVGSSLLADPLELSGATAPNPADRSSLLAPPYVALLRDGGVDHTAAEWPAYSLPYTTNQPSIRFAYEDPLVHSAQNWRVTYEGKLPTVNGLVGTLVTRDKYSSIELAVPGGELCARGIEDHKIGLARIAQAEEEAARLGLTLPSTMASWVGDYVELTDDLLPATDPYWSETPDGGGADCWGFLPEEQQMSASDRYNACYQAFSSSANADQTYSRDFPILASTNDTLTLGRFGWVGTETPGSRIIVGADGSNAKFLQQAQCCFHHQPQFAVRTGGEWVTTGSSAGLLHHVVAGDGGVCTLSCNPDDALLNSRSFGINRVWEQDAGAVCRALDPANPNDVAVLKNAGSIAPDRNSPLALRNPIFSYVMWNGCPSEDVEAGIYSTNVRDETWQFSTGGAYSPQTVSLGSTSVSPQSMMFIESLGQLAVIDGLSQGLILIDLNILGIAHAPYY